MIERLPARDAQAGHGRGDDRFALQPFDIFDQPLDRARFGLGVTVEKDQRLAACVACPQILGGRRSLALVVTDNADLRESLERLLNRTIPRRIVRHDDLAIESR